MGSRAQESQFPNFAQYDPRPISRSILHRRLHFWDRKKSKATFWGQNQLFKLDFGHFNVPPAKGNAVFRAKKIHFSKFAQFVPKTDF